jgi:hypothetical protein
MCVGLALLLSSCRETDFVDPTNSTAGPNSLTAIFTSGTYVDKEAVVYTVPDPSASRFVIPVPYYYPEESDNTTQSFMTSMRVKAGLMANCTLSPALTVLDLTKDNEFTYTDEAGNSRKIIITGQMTKSSLCAIKSFTAKMEGTDDVTGVIDEASKTITLVSFDDLSACTIDVTLSPHATIKDQQATYNFNSSTQITVQADDGTTATYTVAKGVLTKIPTGFRKGSQTTLFQKDIADPNGLAVTDAGTVHPSIAVLRNYLVVDLGDGSTPTYMKKSTGTIIGKIALGSAQADGCVACDLNNNMLICNYAASGSTLNVYKTNSVTTAPTLYLTYQNNTNVGVGYRLHVQGSLDGNAVITATMDNSSNVIRWIVTNGAVGSAENISLSGVSSWGGLDNIASVVSRSATTADGCYVSHYDSGNDNVYYVNSSNEASASLAAQSDGSGWGYNNGSIDVRDFNNAKYLVLYTQGYWPDWGLPGQMYLFDVTSTSSFNGDAIDGAKSLVYQENLYPSTFNNNLGGYTTIGYAGDNRYGNIIMVPSKDGYKLDVYYIDNTSLGVGGIEFDCIDK